MADMDIFHADAFTTLSMTAAVERNPYMPNGIGRLKLFDDEPIYTSALAVEARTGQLVLIPTSDRNAPPMQRITELRNVRSFGVPRLAHADTIMASEVQNIRAFGQESELMQVQDEVARRLYGPTGLLNNLELTKENMRLGAIAGTLVDADGSTLIYDWYTQFGITRPAEIAFNLSGWVASAQATVVLSAPTSAALTAGQGVTIGGAAYVVAAAQNLPGTTFTVTSGTPVAGGAAVSGTGIAGGTTLVSLLPVTPQPDGSLRAAVNAVIRQIKRAAQGAFVDGTTEIWAACGDQFWDLFINHPDITRTYFNFVDARQLREATAFDDEFFWMGVHWFNYRGTDDNSTVAVPPTKVRFFLRYAPGVFRVAWAPAEFMPWVNTKGRPQYVLMIPDRDRNAHMKVEVYSYPLYICTRPETLIQGRM